MDNVIFEDVGRIVGDEIAGKVAKFTNNNDVILKFGLKGNRYGFSEFGRPVKSNGNRLIGFFQKKTFCSLTQQLCISFGILDYIFLQSAGGAKYG